MKAEDILPYEAVTGLSILKEELEHARTKEPIISAEAELYERQLEGARVRLDMVRRRQVVLEYDIAALERGRAALKE